MGYWDGVKSRFNAMVEGELPTQGQQPAPPPPEGAAPAPPEPVEPNMIREKFRQWMGREPYSDQELEDWWLSIR